MGATDENESFRCEWVLQVNGSFRKKVGPTGGPIDENGSYS